MTREHRVPHRVIRGCRPESLGATLPRRGRHPLPAFRGTDVARLTGPPKEAAFRRDLPRPRTCVGRIVSLGAVAGPDEVEHDRASAIPGEVLEAASARLSASISIAVQLAGGVQGGARRARAGDQDVVLKFRRTAHSAHLAGCQRAERVVRHMRSIGYPTPAWIALGETNDFVWHVQEYLDGAPSQKLTDDAVHQLMEVAELQAGQATEEDTWTAYVRLVGSGQHPHFQHLADYSADVRDILEALLKAVSDAPELVGGDMVHGDFNATNFLFANDRLLGVVDIASAASGSRAIDLTTLYWSAASPDAQGSRLRLLRRIAHLAGREGAALLLSRQVQEMLAFPMARGRDDVVAGVIRRAHAALRELRDDL